MTADKDALLRAVLSHSFHLPDCIYLLSGCRKPCDCGSGNLRARITAALAEKDDGGWIKERISQLTAHRACCGSEHDPSQGKLHGYCVVCGVPWPCEYAGRPPSPLPKGDE